jgi:DNA-directed RNA polymerase subunit L
VELAEKYQIAKNAETAQNAKSKSATHTWINILKNICAKSKKIAAEVYSVEVEIEE